MNTSIEPFGIIVKFQTRPHDEMFSALRNHGFRYIAGGQYWHRVSTVGAHHVLACLRRLYQLTNTETTTI